MENPIRIERIFNSCVQLHFMCLIGLRKASFSLYSLSSFFSQFQLQFSSTLFFSFRMDVQPFIVFQKQKLFNIRSVKSFAIFLSKYWSIDFRHRHRYIRLVVVHLILSIDFFCSYSPFDGCTFSTNNLHTASSMACQYI